MPRGHGGAGSGKSTLIQAIVKVLNSERNTVLCAPAGKAARWETVDLVIVDEASMLTLEMMAGILHRYS